MILFNLLILLLLHFHVLFGCFQLLLLVKHVLFQHHDAPVHLGLVPFKYSTALTLYQHIRTHVLIVVLCLFVTVQKLIAKWAWMSLGATALSVACNQF